MFEPPRRHGRGLTQRREGAKGRLLRKPGKQEGTSGVRSAEWGPSERPTSNVQHPTLHAKRSTSNGESGSLQGVALGTGLLSRCQRANQGSVVRCQWSVATDRDEKREGEPQGTRSRRRGGWLISHQTLCPLFPARRDPWSVVGRKRRDDYIQLSTGRDRSGPAALLRVTLPMARDASCNGKAVGMATT
jgi:hypothetical protein